LRDAFRVLSTSADARGRIYVSTAEGRHLPVTATQWHPEKALFEWSPRLAIPRGGAADAAAAHVARFLATEARRSRHAPASAAEEAGMLISNWCAVFTGAGALNDTSSSASGDDSWARFDQVYFFPPWEAA
jgi:gamma-glutamyl hydrolase